MTKLKAVVTSFFILFSSLVNAVYEPASRGEYVRQIITAFKNTSRQDLTNIYQTVSLIEKNQCKSLFDNLTLSCLEVEITKNCNGIQGGFKRDCPLVSDVIIVNRVNEKYFVTANEKIKISENNANYGAALGQALRRRYSLLATEFIFLSSRACKESDASCLAGEINEYCTKNADSKSLSWQSCVSALAWFIGTS